MTAETVPGTRYQADGRQLSAHLAGQGSPAVVFLPGAGRVGLDYLNIHGQIADLTTSVLYDRAGTGWSDEAELPRSAAAVATELHALLQAHLGEGDGEQMPGRAQPHLVDHAGLPGGHLGAEQHQRQGGEQGQQGPGVNPTGHDWD